VELLRTMNSYYSNLIEGHNTHPLAIEKALSGEDVVEDVAVDVGEAEVAAAVAKGELFVV
jgi:hypothetical protein